MLLVKLLNNNLYGLLDSERVWDFELIANYSMINKEFFYEIIISNKYAFCMKENSKQQPKV